MNLDEARALVATHLDGALEVTALSRGPVGNSQETWFLETKRADGTAESLVLRLSSPAGVLAWTDRRQEFEVLRSLAGRVPVPAVHAFGVHERPFILMERLLGVPPARLDAELRVELGRELGSWLARLHLLDPVPSALAVDGDSASATLAQVRHYRDLYGGDRPAPVPLLGALLAWAERNVPRDGVAPVLLWGDPGAHNLLVEGARITALLDWELTHVGHPLEDLGAAVWSCLGTTDAADVIEGYEVVAGPVDREVLGYYTALACATRSVMVVNGAAAWIRGDTTSPAAAALALDLLALDLARGADAAGWGALPASDGRPPRYPLRPDPVESARGVARWLLDDLVPTVDDRRLRQMTKRAAALLEATALRIPEADAVDAGAVEERAVAAELAGGDGALRAELLADLARELARLGPLTRLHRHPSPRRSVHP